MSKRCPRVAFADTEVVVHKTHPPARLQRTTVKQRGEKPLKTVKGQGEGSLAEKKNWLEENATKRKRPKQGGQSKGYSRCRGLWKKQV